MTRSTHFFQMTIGLEVYDFETTLFREAVPRCRAVQIDSVTRPTRKTDRNRPESGRPDCSSGSAADLHHQKSIPAGRFDFPPLKPEPTERFPDSGQNFQIPARISSFRWEFSRIRREFSRIRRKTQIPATFPLDRVRFWPDLAKSHQIQLDFCQI